MTSNETKRKQFIEELAAVRNSSREVQKQFLADLCDIYQYKNN